MNSELSSNPPQGRLYDVIFVGGGLANGLAAYRLLQYRRDLNILLIEEGETLGGRHTWSFHQADMDIRQRGWIAPFISHSWGAYEVQFPNFNRKVCTGYFSARSNQFNIVIQNELRSKILFKTRVVRITPSSVVLQNGKKLISRCVIDGRGWDYDPHVKVAYKKYFNVEARLESPHGLVNPILMDVNVTQDNDCRFIYLLPWTDKTVLIEDTRYSDSPNLNEKDFQIDIFKYIHKKNWQVSSVIREENGVRPIPLEGKLSQIHFGIPLSGSRAGLFHSTTGYSFSAAVRYADELAELGSYDGQRVYEWAKMFSQTHWEQESFNRFLNRMLFGATRPENRFKILQKIYGLSDGFVSRFSTGKMKTMDRLRVIAGSSPIPLSKALKVMMQKEKI